jgi:hypothetical protein
VVSANTGKTNILQNTGLKIFFSIAALYIYLIDLNT